MKLFDTNIMDLLVNKMSVGLFLKDRHRRYADGNKFFLDLISIKSLEEILGKTDEEIATLNYEVTRCTDTDSRVLNGESIYDVQESILNSQENKFVLTNKIPVIDDNQKVVGILGFIFDVTHHEYKEKKILEHIISLMPGFVFWKDTQSVYRGCNDNLLRSAGLKSREQLIGKTDFELPWGQSVGKAFVEADHQIIHSGLPKLNFEEKLVLPDGSELTVLTNKVPLKDEDGTVAGVLAISSDITDRKKIEQQLVSAKEKAEKSNKAKSDFLAVVSHELRTPLTGILGVIDILQYEDPSKKEVAEYLNHIDTASKHLLTIINNILDFAKLNENKFKLVKVPFDLIEVFQKTIDILQAKAHEKEISLTVNYPPELPQYFLGDEKALLQILINLIGNAIKFTEQGGVDITVKEDERTEAHVGLQIEIRDTGIGIPGNKLKKIFDRFEQVNSSKKRAYGGTGLGLSVSQKLVKLMGGSISVNSVLGKGSTFKIILTLERDLQYDSAQKITQEKNENSLATQGNYKVLLVEDDALIQLVHQHKFEQLGCALTHSKR